MLINYPAPPVAAFRETIHPAMTIELKSKLDHTGTGARLDHMAVLVLGRAGAGQDATNPDVSKICVTMGIHV